MFFTLRASDSNLGEEEDPNNPQMARKKALDEYSVGTELSVEPPPPPPPPEDNAAAVTDKKKGKNGHAKAAKANGEDYDDDDVAEVVFAVKKKKGKSKKSGDGGSVFTALANDAINDEDNDGGEVVDGGRDEDDDVSLVAFSGQKKSSKKKSRSIVAKVSDEIGFGTEIVDVVVETEQPSFGISNTVADNNVSKSEEVTAISKNKKKKNKRVITAQEEEDLDKILAELVEGPPIAKPDAPPPQDDKVQPHHIVCPAAAASGEKETVESAAAANKKKKKKKREKEKKVAAAAAGNAPENEIKEVKAESIESKKNESFTKAAEKKVPKHVREMQEALARRKEAEERKKREEEERLMKEEDERRRQEELERQAEEARRQRKEKEKEKLRRRKQEGKLLTGKQKEEARRLEMMRKQFLNSKGDVSLPIGESGALAKRPIYQRKKPKPTHYHQSGAAVVEKVEEEETDQVEEKVELPEAVEDNGVEEDDVEDEWDAKSWDDVILNAKGAFADDEADSGPEPAVEKEITVVTAHNAGKIRIIETSLMIENNKLFSCFPFSNYHNKNLWTYFDIWEQKRSETVRALYFGSSTKFWNVVFCQQVN